MSPIQKDGKRTEKYLPNIDEKQVAQILENAIKNDLSQTELGSGTKRIDKEVMETIRKANIPGIGFIDDIKREYPTTPFASNLIGYASYDEDEQKS